MINFLSQKDAFEPNRREAKRLIAKWTRPIFETQPDYRAINEDFERVETSDRPARQSPHPSYSDDFRLCVVGNVKGT